MDIWNTRQTVVANIPATSAKEAKARLAAALERAGFYVYDDLDASDAFLAETGTEPGGLPSD